MKTGKYFTVLFVCSVILLVSGCAEDPGSDQKEEQITERAKKERATIPSFSQEDSLRFETFFTDLPGKNQLNGNVLIYHRGKVFEKSFGLSSFQTGDSLTREHLFQLASVSKPMTATIVLTLQEKGLLNIKDSVQFYFPDFPYDGITLEMLLSHRSGLPNYLYITDDIWENKDLPICNENVLDSIFTLAPDKYYPADSRFNYCNTNYFMLAAVVEKVTGMSFESAAVKYLFQPAGMKNTFVYSDMNYAAIPGLAAGHSAFGKIKPDFYLNGVTGDKGVFSTARDLYIFDRALTNYELIGEKTLEEMYTPRSAFDRKGKSYALGWRVDNNFDDKVIYHNGWWRGYRSYFVRIPDKDLAVIVLSNTTRGSFLKVADLVNLMSPVISPAKKPTGSAKDGMPGTS